MQLDTAHISLPYTRIAVILTAICVTKYAHRDIDPLDMQQNQNSVMEWPMRSGLERACKALNERTRIGTTNDSEEKE